MKIGDIYTKHHQENRARDFSIMEKERGQYLKEEIGTGKKVLDIGCRNGVLTAHFANGNYVTGVDVDEEALSEARDNLSIKTLGMDLLGDWGELKGEKFDVIVCGEVLEHLYFPEEVVEKVSRHLNESGMFIGTVPNAFNLKNRFRLMTGNKKGTPLNDPTHINQFHFNDISNMMTKYFNKINITGMGKYAKLSKISPNLFSFILVFKCTK